MSTSAEAIQLSPKADFPEDPGLRDLPNLFDGDWVWETYCNEFGGMGFLPQHVRIRQFSHTPGRQAIISYLVEWPDDRYIPSRHFSIRITRDQPPDLFRYPDDRLLPGLSTAAHPETAIQLINKHVFAIPARRALLVELVRYRPGNRAVLRHRISKARFYVRVLQPSATPPLLQAAELIGQSKFAVPRLAGLWQDGGVMWLSEIPGRNMRRHLRQGNMPEPSLLLDGLESLWTVPSQGNAIRPFNLPGAYRRAKQTFHHVVKGDEDIGPIFNSAARALDQFVESWEPTGTAHNDFYDDQMLVLPEGKIALVDFEEAGPGDPMLDVGNFLAHLNWGANLGKRKRHAEACREYHRLFRGAALERFQWNEKDLNMREAVCLFRVCTNTVRHIQGDWRARLESGLSLVNRIAG